MSPLKQPAVRLCLISINFITVKFGSRKKALDELYFFFDRKVTLFGAHVLAPRDVISNSHVFCRNSILL